MREVQLGNYDVQVGGLSSDGGGISDSGGGTLAVAVARGNSIHSLVKSTSHT